MPMAPVLFRRLALACAMMLPIIAAPLRAQPVPIDSVRIDDPALVYAVTLTNATTLIGRITLVSADSVRVVSAAMTATVARREVRSVRAYPATALHDGVLWPENPHATRLLFAPTAIPLRRGEGYFADFWIFFASAAVGVTDRFTMGAGMSLFPSDDFTDHLFYALPKYTVVSQPRLKVALGALMASVPWSSNDDGGRRRQSLGILYGVATTGSPESNLTLGAGWGYVGGRAAPGHEADRTDLRELVRSVRQRWGRVRVVRRADVGREDRGGPGAGQPRGHRHVLLPGHPAARLRVQVLTRGEPPRAITT